MCSEEKGNGEEDKVGDQNSNTSTGEEGHSKAGDTTGKSKLSALAGPREGGATESYSNELDSLQDDICGGPTS